MTLQELRRRGLIDPEASEEYTEAPVNVKNLLARWAVWYGKSIHAGMVKQIMENHVVMQHAELAHKMFEDWECISI